MTLEQLYTVAEVAALAKLTPKTIRRHIASGDIAIVRPTQRTVRVTASEVERFLRRSQNGNGPT